MALSLYLSSPLWGSSKPKMISINVVLPEPEAPIKPTISDRFISTEISFIAGLIVLG